MERKEFLNMIFSFFNVKDEGQTLFKSYDLALSKYSNIDWDKLYIKTLENAASRYLPAPKFFLEIMPTCLKKNKSNILHEGNHIRIIFDTGRYTDFVVSGFGLTLEDIKKSSLKNDSVKEVRMYPNEMMLDGISIKVSLIGDCVYPEGTPYKIIYVKASLQKAKK